MGINLKRVFHLLRGVSVALFSSAFAEGCPQQHCGGLTLVEADVQRRADHEMCRHGVCEEVVPAVKPAPASSDRLFFQVEPIFWTAVRDGGAYGVHGIKVEETTDSKYQPAPRGRVEFIGTDWKPGLRVGVGALFGHVGHDVWDVSLRYTCLCTKRRDRRGNFAYTEVPFLSNFTSDPGFGGVAMDIKASGRFNFNVLDMEVGRRFFLSPCLTVRPYIGVKTTWQKEHDDFTYLGGLFALGEKDISIRVTGPYYVDYRRNVLGIGLRSGCSLSWPLCRGLSIYGDFAWAVLWTHCYTQHRRDTLRDVKIVDKSKEITDTVVVDVENKGCHSAKNLCEFECGLSWEACFCDGNYHLEARLGWAEQVWVNWVENWFLDGTCNNLSLYGPKVTLRFGF